MPNSLDPAQDRQSVGPDLGPNCLQNLSADDSKERVDDNGMLIKLHSKAMVKSSIANL